jgi:hypothetical protein
MPEGRGSVPEGRSDRSLAQVPGTAPPQKNRPVGHGMIGRRPNPRSISPKGAPCFRRIGGHTGANQTVPYGTALLTSLCPRHFVPGYDRTVPPGLEGKPLRLRGKKLAQFLNI